MAEQNPFSSLLDPGKKGTLTGFLGGVMGNPTQSQDQGNATGAALANLAQLKEQGMQPQQALLKFFQTPQGMDYFTRTGPEGLDKLTAGITSLYKPEEKPINVAAGGALVTPQGKELYKNPAADKTEQTPAMRNFNYFAEIAGLNPEERKKLAVAQIAPNPQKPNEPSEGQIAINALVTAGKITPEAGQAMQAGMLKVVPAKDQYGNSTGDVTVVDLANNTSTLLKPGDRGPSQDKSPSSVATGVTGATPQDGAATGVIPPAKTPDPTKDSKFFGSKKDMFLAAGIVPNASAIASKVGEQLDPSFIMPEGAKAEDRSNLVKSLRASIAGMASADGGLGVNKNVVESMLALVPDTGIFSSPHSAVQSGIRLLEKVQQEVAAEEAKTTRGDLPQSEKVNSAKRMEAWRKVERSMPTMDEMKEQESAIRSGTAGAPTIREGINTILEYGKKGKKNAQDQVAAPDISAMPPDQLVKIDPRQLSTQDLVKFKQRLIQLKNGGK